MPDAEFVVRPEGDLDLATVPAVSQEWLSLIEDFQPDLLVIDLGAVTFLDSTALTAIVIAYKRQREHGGRLVVTNASPLVARAFRLTGLHAYIDITLRDDHANEQAVGHASEDG
jgi:anti-sigma B factor antagonist